MLQPVPARARADRELLARYHEGDPAARDEVMERFGFTDCLVSDYGLREGVLIDRWQKRHARS